MTINHSVSKPRSRIYYNAAVYDVSNGHLCKNLEQVAILFVYSTKSNDFICLFDKKITIFAANFKLNDKNGLAQGTHKEKRTIRGNAQLFKYTPWGIISYISARFIPFPLPKYGFFLDIRKYFFRKNRLPERFSLYINR